MAETGVEEDIGKTTTLTKYEESDEDNLSEKVTESEEDEDDLPVDLSQLKPLPMAKTLLLLTNYIANSTRFLNHFSQVAEEKIGNISNQITRLEITLCILEAKLNSIPDLDMNPAPPKQQTVEKHSELLPEVGDPSEAPPPPPPPPPPPSTSSPGNEEEGQIPDGGMHIPPPPPPPPPPAGLGPGEEGELNSGTLSLSPPPPPPPPPATALPSVDETMTQETALVVVEEEGDGVTEPDDDGVLKLKDDPIYKKYFSMKAMGLPDGAVRQKMMMDGLNPDVLDMDPDSPSPGSPDEDDIADSFSASPIVLPPALPSVEPPQSNLPPPPPPLFDSHLPNSNNDERREEDAMSQGEGVDIDSLDVQQSTENDFVKLKDDPEFEKYFKMKSLGMPDGAIFQKMMMDGVSPDILDMDPEGPSPNS